MKTIVEYGKNINDDLMNQLMYLHTDAYAFYESLNSDEHMLIIGAIPSTTLKQFKKKVLNVLYFIRLKTNKNGKNQVIGMVCISKHNKDTLCLHDVYVKPLYRNKRIGTILMNKAIIYAKTQHKKLILKVNPLNTIAFKFYEKLGFKTSKYQNLHMEMSIE